MKKPHPISHGGLTLDLSQIKSFQVDSWLPHNKSNILRVELKSRFEYIINPETNSYEKILIQDYIEHPYSDYETAIFYRDEWEEIWKDFLLGNL